ncbi:hypothetical protein O181_082360 [Austropuccinia psidii MF-1]|uniref:CCHC-type domain-containing protein n=1 Tax=Austropuccinia psidii MF-1 TaxID=1389203 RepID=A0A9Q3FRQ4_9BASI|nr:hypothetical protein [Austropuccinia psidii MF-1]
MPGELENEIRFSCNQSCILDDIANTLQDVRKKINIAKYSQYKSISFKEKQPFRVDLKDKLKERVAEVTKKKNSCHNCGATDHYANKCPKEKKTFDSIEQVPEEDSTKEDSELNSIGDAIREQSDKTNTQGKNF